MSQNIISSQKIKSTLSEVSKGTIYTKLNFSTILTIIEKNINFTEPQLYLLCYMFNKVLFTQTNIMEINDTLRNINFDLLNEMRIIGTDSEFHLIKIATDEYIWRIRVDRDDINIQNKKLGEENNISWFYVDKHLINISKADFKVLNKEEFSVRNYFEYDENGLINFYDARIKFKED